jgi:hypothetical protein
MIRSCIAGWAAVLSVMGLVLVAVPSSRGALLVRYGFDEPSGNALDTGTGAPANGQLLDGATRSNNTPSGSGRSLDLTNDDPNALVLDGDADKLDGLTKMTVSTWLNVSAYPGDAGSGVTNSGNKRLASKQDVGGGGFTFNMNSTVNDGTAGANDFKLGLFIGDAGGVGFTFGTSTADVDANTISAQDHWVFVAATYDGTLATDNTKFYIGDANTPLSQLGATLTLGQTPIGSGSARFGVGFTDAAASGFDFSVDGYQDDVRVYDTALSPAELDAVRLEGAVPEPGSLVLMLLAGAVGWRRRCRA